MSDIILPPDPLLQRAVAIPDASMSVPPDGNQTGEQSSADAFAPGIDGQDTMMFPAFTFHANVPQQASLLQYVSGFASSKKLSGASTQELHRFATASDPERQMMSFALGLEIRDGVNALTATVAASGVHPDLLKNVKRFTAAAFFSPHIAYYAAPSGAKRVKNLHNAVYDVLVSLGLPHLPSEGDQALKDKVIQAIGREFTTHRSNVKDEMTKRKPGESKTDIASFTATLLRNTSIKITREHYGRAALLSREYRKWADRESTPGLTQATMKLGYWDWIDAALKAVRSEVAASSRDKDDALHTYFEEVIKADEALFSKAVSKAGEPRERESWQANVESAMGRLVA